MLSAADDDGGGALADTAPVKMEVPPEAIETQAEGELETYGLTFPEDMPLGGAQLVLFARAEFEKNDWTRLPKCNEYTQWYYHDKREIGWCSVFQIYCAYHSGLQLVRYKQDVDVQPDDCISAMEGRVGNVRLAFEEHGRWLDGTEGAVPKPGLSGDLRRALVHAVYARGDCGERAGFGRRAV